MGGAPRPAEEDELLAAIRALQAAKKRAGEACQANEDARKAADKAVTARVEALDAQDAASAHLEDLIRRM